MEFIEKDLANFQSSGETVLMGDFNAHINTRDKDYIDGDSFMPDILPASYGPRQANLVLIAYASSEGSGEPAHPRSLARTFAARSYKQ